MPFPPNIRVATEDAFLAEPHRAYLLAVPSAHLRETLRRLGPSLDSNAALLSVVKGIEADTHCRMSEVIVQELPGRGVAVLSGQTWRVRSPPASRPAAWWPRRMPRWRADGRTTGVGSVPRLHQSGRRGRGAVRALKNVVALAAGMVDGLAFGDSAKAGIITRGLAEMTRLGVAAARIALTFAGLAGVGDLIATCMSPVVAQPARRRADGLRPDLDRCGRPAQRGRRGREHGSRRP